MFLPTLTNQLTKEQELKWLAKADSYEIVGTYAQTEMGHGQYKQPSDVLSRFLS